jgi:hypothetical protein
MNLNIIVPAATAIIGIVIGFLLNLWRDMILKNKELEQKELEFQRDYKERYIIMPIISSIDDILMMMERHYVSGLNDNQADTTVIYEKLWDKGGTVRARIIALDDDLMQKTYNDFINDVISFLGNMTQGKSVENGEVVKMRKDAQQKAGIIFDRLKPKLIRK